MKLSKYRKEKLLSGLVLFFRLGLGCLFIWSSLPKIRHPYNFLSSVYSYELVGPKLGMLTAMIIPWLELLLGIFLLTGIFVGGALLICAGLFTLFTFNFVFVLHRGLEIGCGCFSSSDQDTISYVTLIRSCIFLAICIAAYICWLIYCPENKHKLRT